MMGGSSMMKNRCCEEGLSLIELLIASVIAASAAALLLGGLMAANRGAELRIEQALSTQALASELAQLGEHVDGSRACSIQGHAGEGKGGEELVIGSYLR